MELKICPVGTKTFIIWTTDILHDIEYFEKKGLSSGYINGSYRPGHPIYDSLKCFVDNIRLNPSKIEKTCMETCPHPIANNPNPDDGCHLTDCINLLANTRTVKGPNTYIEIREPSIFYQE